MARFSWKRDRGSFIGTPESHTLRKDGVSYAVVQKADGGYFTYSVGPTIARFNTCKEPTTLEEAKAYALSRIRAVS